MDTKLISRNGPEKIPKKYMRESYTFIRAFLRKFEVPPLKDWQTKLLTIIYGYKIKAMRDGADDYLMTVILCGAYGVGKTYLIALNQLISMMFAAIYGGGEKYSGVAISGTAHQLKTVFWSELEMVAATTDLHNFFKIKGDKCRFAGAPNIRTIAKVINPYNMATSLGVHGKIVDIVLEEGPGIPDNVHEKVKSYCTSAISTLIISGNPLLKSGFFYRLMECENPPVVGHDIMIRARINRKDFVKGFDAYSERIKAEYGVDSDEYRTGVLGLFAEDSIASIFPSSIIDRWLERPYYIEPEPVYFIGIDVAEGEDKDRPELNKSDYSAIVVRSKTTLEYIYRSKVRHEELFNVACGIIDSYQPYAVVIDEVGVGNGLFQRICAHYDKSRIIVAEMRANFKSANTSRFANRATELYWVAKDWIQDYASVGYEVGKEEHDQLLLEMRGVKVTTEERSGCYKLVPKRQLTIRSPDVMDALSYSFHVSQSATALVGRNPGFKELPGFRGPDKPIWAGNV